MQKTFQSLLLGLAFVLLTAGTANAQSAADGIRIAPTAAAFFGMQAVFNIGCCGIGTCQPGTKATAAPDLNAPVTYEEIR